MCDEDFLKSDLGVGVCPKEIVKREVKVSY